VSTSELPFLPYGRQAIDDDDIAAVSTVLRAEYLTGGPAVADFETDLKSITAAAHAVACSTGTAALHLAYSALGVGAGDCVVVPALTFLATANAAHYAGAEVEFADVDANTGLMMPDHAAAALARAQQRGLRVKVLTPVYLSGQTGDPEGMAALAAAHGAVVVEDACHALGSRYRDKAGVEHRVGAGAHAAATCFSFHPVKTIAMGEGGAVTTPDADLDAKMRMVRNHGMTRDAAAFTQTDLAFDTDGTANPWYYEMQVEGNNYRASDIHCALGSSQLKKLDRFVARRRVLIALYRDALATLPMVRPIDLIADSLPAWHLNVVLIDFAALGISRAQVMAALKEQGIGSQVHYMPVPWHPYWRSHCQGQGPWPGAALYYQRCLSLPLFPTMADSDVDRTIAALGHSLGHAKGANQ
jgi:UDP-4-amino-4,6-dideoxy-N-acetyl-beta-L-altrosamine transaminase